MAEADVNVAVFHLFGQKPKKTDVHFDLMMMPDEQSQKLMTDPDSVNGIL